MKRIFLICILMLSASVLLAGDRSNSKSTYSNPPITAGGCDYVVGDVNGSDNYNGLDIVFGVAYFFGGLDPVCDCDCPPHSLFWTCGDVNNSCNYNGLDITYGIAYFKGGPAPVPCQDCPPAP